VLYKAAQGFAVRRTQCTSQPETRGERRTTQKRPFMDGYFLSDQGIGDHRREEFDIQLHFIMIIQIA
jgi:hypothetical protein